MQIYGFLAALLVVGQSPFHGLFSFTLLDGDANKSPCLQLIAPPNRVAPGDLVGSSYRQGLMSLAQSKHCCSPGCGIWFRDEPPHSVA